MNDHDERWHWHDQRGVTWAAAVAAVALIVLLVVAVLRTGSSNAPSVAPPQVSEVTTSESAVGSVSPTTSYPVPSVQTSEDASPELPSTGDATPQESPATATTSTTTANPYVTTTTQNGGAV
ncbi:MAG: hypothetical protein ABW001_05020 [Mycobacterium sp.]